MIEAKDWKEVLLALKHLKEIHITMYSNYVAERVIDLSEYEIEFWEEKKDQSNQIS